MVITHFSANFYREMYAYDNNWKANFLDGRRELTSVSKKARQVLGCHQRKVYVGR